MHGGIRTWPVFMLAALAVCATPAMAQYLTNPAIVPGYDDAYAASPAPIPGRTVSATLADEKPDLAAEVAELKAEVEKMKDKAAAAKKKAASKPAVKAGGRIMWDNAAFGQGPVNRTIYGDAQNGTEFRRARLFLEGKDVFEVIDYKIQFDFADADGVNPDFKDVYITIKHLPWVGHVKMGHFKETIGLEELTSSKYITFMERSMAVEAFTPERNMGVCAYNPILDERATWAVGAYTSECDDDPPVFQDDDGGYALTMRGTFLPWYDEATNGRGLIHTGLAYSYRNIADGTVQHRSHPDAHLAPRVVDTGAITNVPDESLLGAELAMVYGPFSLQSEYYGNWVSRSGVGTGYLNGYYVYASYFLTGESRNYKRSGGYFDRVKPFTNFFRVRTCDGVQTGWGAWELAYRYDSVNLVDLSAGIDGGFADGHTFGVNWYLNPYTRMMFNYVLVSSTPSVSAVGARGAALPVSDINCFQMRCQIDF